MMGARIEQCLNKDQQRVEDARAKQHEKENEIGAGGA